MWIVRVGAAFALLIAQPALGETLTNASVVALVKSGVGDEVVIAKIERSEVRFDLSTEQIISLKRQGVSGPVLAAMLKANDAGNDRTVGASSPPSRTAAPGTPVSIASLRSPGIYFSSGSQLVRMDPSVSSQMKTGGTIGMALTGGLIAASMKAVIPGENARTKTNGAPVFYFYFGAGQEQGNPLWTVAGAPSSPNEFSLLRFKQKDGRREARIGKMGFSGVKTGVMDKERIDFTYEEVRPGLFAVRPAAPLAAGEYGFIAPMGTAGASSARIFDFSVS